MTRYLRNGYADEQIPILRRFSGNTHTLTFHGLSGTEGTSIPKYNVDLKIIVDA